MEESVLSFHPNCDNLLKNLVKQFARPVSPAVLPSLLRLIHIPLWFPYQDTSTSDLITGNPLSLNAAIHGLALVHPQGSPSNQTQQQHIMLLTYLLLASRIYCPPRVLLAKLLTRIAVPSAESIDLDAAFFFGISIPYPQHERSWVKTVILIRRRVCAILGIWLDICPSDWDSLMKDVVLELSDWLIETQDYLHYGSALKSKITNIAISRSPSLYYAGIHSLCDGNGNFPVMDPSLMAIRLCNDSLSFWRELQPHSILLASSGNKTLNVMKWSEDLQSKLVESILTPGSIEQRIMWLEWCIKLLSSCISDQRNHHPALAVLMALLHPKVQSLKMEWGSIDEHLRKTVTKARQLLELSTGQSTDNSSLGEHPDKLYSSITTPLISPTMYRLRKLTDGFPTVYLTRRYVGGISSRPILNIKKLQSVGECLDSLRISTHAQTL
eukprot:NODE_2802_length_1490_cov_60.908559_g2421_i0.p1 GENE.NODE_2802_length_1490_cov_60.908559_g2421_i0~~NODE_2802_length_1490_cov_60.908559_g2421_i0.p1  ORF type:complete len:440 (+),score=78.02 NODE_2802_length_1490_cov_60.908559_g2421_i0:67-1386(+)